jgi:hypothetical protein
MKEIVSTMPEYSTVAEEEENEEEEEDEDDSTGNG